MEHADLVSEMSQVEHLSTQDRLHLARMRRTQQLKVAKQKEKEWQKAQNRRDRNSNVNYKNKKHIEFQDSVMLLEAAARNDISEVAKLLQKNVTPDATNEDGLTALHQCCIDNNSEMLRLLLDYGANVNAQDSEKWTPLHAAATCGHLNLVKFLIGRGANLLAVNADGNMPYDLCDDEETLDCIEAEMSRRGVTQELIDETRAATESKMLRDLEELSLRGGDLEMPDLQGATPLHIAAANGYARVVEFLLEQHVSVDAVDNDLWSPVHAAACWGHLEVLEMLAQSGADLLAKNKNEETPSDICEDTEIRERIEQLKTEQESKRLAEAQRRRVRRSQSNNTRVHSVRRTSLRDKTLTTKKDAVEETRLRLQAQEGYTTTDGVALEPSSITSDSSSPSLRQSSNNNSLIPMTPTLNNGNHNNNINNNNNHNTPRYPTAQNPLYTNGGGGGVGQTAINSSPIYPSTISSTPNNHLYDRRSPEGKDNEAYVPEDRKMIVANNNSQNISPQKNGGTELATTEIYSASNENGKINVQVTVLFGTLADLKKHRAQSRTSNSPENGSIMTSNLGQPVELALLSTSDLHQQQQSPTAKFSGITGDVVSDSTHSRRCCIIM